MRHGSDHPFEIRQRERIPFREIAKVAYERYRNPLALGRLFDTVGRQPMITATYLGSGIIVAVIALLAGSLTVWPFILLVCLAFFVASAGAGAAYLAVSEIFPMETRGLAIALFYAVGTAAGGITGPLLFGHFIHSGQIGRVSLGFLIGAVIMALASVAELLWGVNAEGKSLERIARPLTALTKRRKSPGPAAEPQGD